MPGDDTRDRVIRLETQVEHLAEAVENLTASVKTLNALLEQARGAKWMLLGMAGLGGFLAGKIAGWFGVFPK